MDKREIGRRLRAARKLRKLTTKAAAEAAGISRSTLSMYESGHRIPRDEVKITLAKVYDLPIQVLFY